MTRLTLCVPYAIRGASRPRARRKGAYGVDVYMPPEHRNAEADLVTLLASAAREQGWTRVDRPGVVALTIRLYVARPKREVGVGWRDGPYLIGGKPDADNVAKLVMDAGTKAGLWQDDTQVAALLVDRWRTAKDGAPTSIVAVETLPGPVVTKRHRRTE